MRVLMQAPFGNIDSKPSSFQATVQNVTGMLFARQASGAVLADTRAASQAKRAKNGGPEAISLILKPAPDIGRRFGLVRFHECICVTLHIYLSREK